MKHYWNDLHKRSIKTLCGSIINLKLNVHACIHAWVMIWGYFLLLDMLKFIYYINKINGIYTCGFNLCTCPILSSIFFYNKGICQNDINNPICMHTVYTKCWQFNESTHNIFLIFSVSAPLIYTLYKIKVCTTTVIIII
jgi:hypothetical protein